MKLAAELSQLAALTGIPADAVEGLTAHLFDAIDYENIITCDRLLPSWEPWSTAWQDGKQHPHTPEKLTELATLAPHAATLHAAAESRGITHLCRHLEADDVLYGWKPSDGEKAKYRLDDFSQAESRRHRVPSLPPGTTYAGQVKDHPEESSIQAHLWHPNSGSGWGDLILINLNDDRIPTAEWHLAIPTPAKDA